ncbi:hypothetical protein F441_09774 [Phytophthora nicotianae CJ01A1]|uniref:TRP C-terminal domain-containing protein n=4 Tax=Phytophthora nicotianae TaxID=4792 RepID=V9F4J3_PHYNI|nr:hypothetical protein F443_09825 [Phytophthora nicotianae P1569]ETO74334.1 hypothetical protein F444_09919 [Phytophthora nicotianae P1976]ETP15496.1 hypothetical protein F441_09774 [Phytophthora nicotianae CJ01A1]KUF64295.1 hypothetical protein AM587_10009498 [Phytophthora nicotianae]
MKVLRGSSSRLWQVAGLFLLTSALASANTAPSLYDYKYDGTTTYCYWMDQGMQVSNFDFAYVLEEGTNSECPLTVSLQQATTGTIVAGSEVEYAFTATLNLNDNVFNLTQLQTTVPDPTTGLPMQVGHANIHTCSRSTVCDIFRTGSNRKIADQETSNFTSSGTTSFRQKITYNSAGERNVFAHIILPPKDYLEESYHFITFITTNVEASTTSTADDDSSGLSTGATVGMIIGAVAIVVAVILSVVFWRRKRRPGQDTDHFRNSGFGLPASYVASKSKSHLDWNAEPEARLTSHGSGWKDYSAGDRSRGSRGPGLNASALAFNDRLSRQNKTVSSSGSLHSSRGPADIYNNYDTPMQRSAAKFGSARDPFNRSQSMYPDDSMYDDGESRIVEEDPNLEYGRTPDLETFGIGPGGQGPSFESETSIGTSFEYNTDDSHYNQPTFNPLLSGYGDRESDMSSMGETDDYNMYEQPPPRMRGDTLDAVLTAMPDDQGSESGDRPSSVSSIGTVDFTQDEPSVRSAKPITFEPLDETLTMSGIAKAKAANSGLANTNSSENNEFVLHDSSVDLATSNVSSDYASTVSSVDIDGNRKFDNTLNSTSDIVSNADIVSTTDFESSVNTDFASNIASTEFSASGNGDFTKPSSHSDGSFSSGLEGSSFDSGLESSSYGTDVTGSSYGTGLTGSSYGTDVTGNSYNTDLADSALDATKTENDLNNTHSTYDFDDKSFRASNSFATSASDDDPTGEGLRPRRVSSADGESYEF